MPYEMAAVLYLIAGAAQAAPATPNASSAQTAKWFQTTEQALMDALAPGDKAVWERIMDRPPRRGRS